VQVLKEASRLYAASWVRDIDPELRPNDYKKDEEGEGKPSTGAKSRTMVRISLISFSWLGFQINVMIFLAIPGFLSLEYRRKPLWLSWIHYGSKD